MNTNIYTGLQSNVLIFIPADFHFKLHRLLLGVQIAAFMP